MSKEPYAPRTGDVKRRPGTQREPLDTAGAVRGAGQEVRAACVAAAGGGRRRALPSGPVATRRARVQRGNRATPVERARVDARAKRWQQRFEIPVLVAALLVVPVMIVEQSNAGESW
jgi:hypothetical protein